MDATEYRMCFKIPYRKSDRLKFKKFHPKIKRPGNAGPLQP